MIILTALGVVAFISLIYGLSAKPKWQSKTADQGAVIQTGSDSRGNPADVISQTKRRAVRTRFHSWKRNIFIPKGVPGTVSSKLSLSGILASGKGFKAMIGDSIVGKGDKIDGNTVIEVEKEKVILNDGTKDFELKLEK